MFTFKEGVIKLDVSAEIWFAVGVAARVHSRLFDNPMVVTSMRDGTHMANSLHYSGHAVDIRTKDIAPAAAHALYVQIKEALHPLGYDVEDEHTPPHIHIEFDPDVKAGRVFPTVPGTEFDAVKVGA